MGRSGEVPGDGSAWNGLVGQVREAVATVVPASVPVLVVADGFEPLLAHGGRRAGNFPQDGLGRPVHHRLHDDRRAAWHIEAMRALGYGALVIPSPERWWLDVYADLAAHLARFTRLWDDASCCIYDLRAAQPGRPERPNRAGDTAPDRPNGAGDTAPGLLLADVVAAFDARHGRLPSVLDWATGADLGSSLPGVPVVTVAAGRPMDHLDRSLDLVVVADGAAPGILAEAQRVAASAVATLVGPARRPLRPIGAGGTGPDGAERAEATGPDGAERAEPRIRLVFQQGPSDPTEREAQGPESPALPGRSGPALGRAVLVVDLGAATGGPSGPTERGAQDPAELLRVLTSSVPDCLDVEVLGITDADVGPAGVDARVQIERRRAGGLEGLLEAGERSGAEVIITLGPLALPVDSCIATLLRTLAAAPEVLAACGCLVDPIGQQVAAGGVLLSDGDVVAVGGDPGTDPFVAAHRYVRPAAVCPPPLLAVRRRALVGRPDLSHLASVEAQHAALSLFLHERGGGLRYQPEAVVVDLRPEPGLRPIPPADREVLRRTWPALVASAPAAEAAARLVRARTTGRALRLPLCGAARALQFPLYGAARALVVQMRHPTPDRDAGSGLTMDVVGALQASGSQVTFCALQPQPGQERYARDLRQAGVEVHDGLDALREILSGGDLPGGDLSGGEFDVAVLVYWQAAELAGPIIRELSPRTAVVVHSGDLHFLRTVRRAAAAGAPVQDTTGPDFSRELNAYLLADRVITVSDDEAALLVQLLGERRRVVTVPLSQPAPPRLVELGQRQGLLFLGNFRHIPNLEAALYLCDVVLPHVDPAVLRRHPLTVVGDALDEPWYREVQASVARFPGVRFPGWVPDAAQYVRQARLMVAPLLHGAGVKGKILASLAAGTPVVTTPVGVEGLDPEVAAAALVVETPYGLAAAIERLLTDDDEWAALAAAGPPAVARAHGPAVASARLRDVLAEVIGSPERRRLPTGSVASFAAGAHRVQAQQQELVVRDLGTFVEAVTPPDAEVLVIAEGDERLPAVPGRVIRPFPTGEDGAAAVAPVDGPAAVAHLRAQVDRGARFLVVPAPALSWLHRFPELARFLEAGACVLRNEVGRVYRLPPILARRGRIVAAVPDEVTARLEATPPATCQVEARPWDGEGPLPFADVKGADLLVAVRPGAVLPPGFWDALAEIAERLLPDTGFDIVQPAFAAGSGGPPAYEAQGGLLARGMPVLSGAPVLAAPGRAAGRLAAAVAAGSPSGMRAVVVDAVPVGVTTVVAQRLRQAADATLVLDAAVSRRRGLQALAADTPKPDISVVIATYRRPELLGLCLSSFADQDLAPERFEVVVVDDGSGDTEAFEIVERCRHRLPVTVVGIEHAGRSAAKNVGILAARGDLVLLFDDDDVATAGLLAAHLACHREHPEPEIAVLGRTTWAPALPVSPVMHHVTEVGMLLFSYSKISAGQLLDFRHFWEGRISAKRAFLLAHGLHDQRLAYTIDIELGHRLDAAGLKVVYAPEALSHMVRTVTTPDFARRCEAKGRAARQLSQLHPSPQMRAYCHIDDAEATFPSLAATLEDDLAEVASLEQQAGPRVSRSVGPLGPLRAEAPSDVAGRLDALYARVFKAHTYRGIVEAGGRTPGSPELSVVLPVWNVTEDLAAIATRTIERIWSVAQVPTEVIVVDNGSPVRRDLRATTVLRWDENRGVAPAWNAGLAAAGGRVVAVLNSDVFVEPGWDEALVEAASSGRRIAFPFTDHCDGLGPRRPDKGGTAGWCFALTRALFDELGPFDEQFAPAYWEDTDYWHRAHLAGVALAPVPAAVVAHARRTTARHLDGFDELFARNRRRYEAKHGMRLDEAPPYYHRTIEDHVAEPGG